jgi:hypothetical protein
LVDRSLYLYLDIKEEFLKNIFSSLKSNFKLMIMDEKRFFSCAQLSLPMVTSLIILGKKGYRNQKSLAKGFLHELGHSLGLRDEGISGEAKRCPPGPPNCATTKEEAKKWWADLVGKENINGCCGNKNYIRPTIASLMNNPDKARNFGPVNERYLRKVLLAIKDDTYKGEFLLKKE